ncbi:hypothetical protein F5141DRAFT_1061845 [Pisolithus sp. B1]|nr:hypothetical protein F5141DRAFT_1061845 [Pisolithus sp. B1]
MKEIWRDKETEPALSQRPRVMLDPTNSLSLSIFLVLCAPVWNHTDPLKVLRNAVGVPYEIPVTVSLIDLFQWIHEMTLLHDILVEEALVTLAGMSEEFHNVPLTIMIKTAQDSQCRKVTDPRTQQISSGRWISYSAWRRHVKEEETRVKLERSRDDDIPLEANLLAATLSEPHVKDCVLSLRSVGIQHTSNGVSGRPFDGELRMADIDMVDVSQTSDDDAHDTRESERCEWPLDMKKSALFLAHQSAIGKTMELVDSVSSQSHDSVRTARRNLI